MISISKITTGNSLVIDELPQASSIYDGLARVGRYKTLDGGTIIDHQGYVSGDRSLQIKCKLSEADETIVRSLFENETLVHVSTKHGFFSAAISSLKGDNGAITLTILLKEAV